MKNIILLVIATLPLTIATTARADDAAGAEAAFQEARRLARAGNYAEACPKFEASYRAAPALGALLNLADCHERVGRTATAWAEFREAAELARRRVDSRESFARERVTVLEARLVRLRVVPPPSPPRGLVVRRGSSDVTSLLDSAIPVDPGEHVIEASAPGHVTWTGSVEVRGDGRTIVVAVPALDAIASAALDEPAATPLITEDEAVEDPGRRRRWLGLALGGAGVVGVGAGLVLGHQAMSRWDERVGDCRADNVCNGSGRDAIASARRFATAADVVTGIGIVAIAAGAVVWWTAPTASAEDAEDAEDEGIAVAPAIGGDQIGVSVFGAF